MTSTLTSSRRISVRSGTTTIDLSVPLGTRVAELVTSGGFPPGAHLVDASGAAVPEGGTVGEVFEDGALAYVVDDVHTPSLTRLGAVAPPRGVGPVDRAGPGQTGGPSGAEAAPPVVATADPGAIHMVIDPASAGARTRSTSRRAVGGTGVRTPERAARDEAFVPPPADADSTDAPPATGRRAVRPPVLRRAPSGDTAGTRDALPPPPGPTRSPVPLPPGTDLAGPAPAPPRITPPPTGATRRAASATRGGHRAASDHHERPTRRPAGPAAVPIRAGVVAVPMTLAGAAALLVLLAGLTTTLPGWSTSTAGVALVLGGALGALRPGDSALERWARVAATVVGGCGGFVLAVSAGLDPDVAGVCGLVVATALAMLGRVAAIRQGVFDPWITVTAVGFGALALDSALAVALSWPAYVGPLLLAGVSPLVMRSLPALSLDVPEEQLIDTERLSNTSWSARTGVKRKRRPLRPATVQLITLRATGIVAAGTVSIALLMTSGYGIAVLSTPPGEVARWSLLAEGLLLLAATGLSSRTVRARFGKRVLRLTAAVLALETGYFVSRQFGDTADVALVVAAVASALAVLGIAAALDVGWRSLRLSRIADMVEGFGVVLALPAALLACDVIAVLRQAAS